MNCATTDPQHTAKKRDCPLEVLIVGRINLSPKEAQNHPHYRSREFSRLD